MYVSSKRDGERSRDKSVGVGCENREIMLLGGHRVGRAGIKKLLLHCQQKR